LRWSLQARGILSISRRGEEEEINAEARRSGERGGEREKNLPRSFAEVRGVSRREEKGEEFNAEARRSRERGGEEGEEFTTEFRGGKRSFTERRKGRRV